MLGVSLRPPQCNPGGSGDGVSCLPIAKVRRHMHGQPLLPSGLARLIVSVV